MTTHTRKKTVLLLFGGESTEHDVSIMSAFNVFNGIDLDKVTPILCYIDTQGKWWHVDSVAKHHTPTTPITPVLGSSTIIAHDQHIAIDAIFPVLHGRNGEDGTVQGLATLLHTPIVGCGLDGSLICMDKPLAKQLLDDAGIPVVPGKTYRAAAGLPDFTEITRHLGPILFIKPVRQGSSVGVGKATNSEEFIAAFQEAAKYDDAILIESAITGVRELEVAVRGNTHQPQVSVVGEIVPDREFYSYESKYGTTSTSTTIIPAAIDAVTMERIQAYAAQAYTVLRCRGLARIDFFLAADGSIYLNEANTMPGFTNISMYPKLWEATGMRYSDLVMSLIEQAA